MRQTIRVPFENRSTVLAPEGRQLIAGGVSSRNATSPQIQPWKGDKECYVAARFYRPSGTIRQLHSNLPITRSRWIDRVFNRADPGFTLIELLVVVAVIGLLVAVLLPTLQSARIKTRIVIAHSDLRQICIALDGYAMDNHDQVPVSRRACGTNINYQLPIELSNQFYLPRSDSRIPQAEFLDIFDPRDPEDPDDPQRTYKYRSPGAIWQNGQFYDFPDPADSWRPRAEIWVPDDFPRCESTEGRFFYDRTDEPPCPVIYTVWSIGPDPESPKFPRHEGNTGINIAKFPLPRQFWLQDSGDTGLITHFRSRQGHTYTSP